MTDEIFIDASALVALFDETDIWYNKTVELLSVCGQRDINIVVLDSVINETITVLIRRFHNKKKVDKLEDCFNRITTFAPPEELIPTSSIVQENFYQILNIITKSNYQLGFNDALIVLYLQHNKLDCIVSFDTDFDAVPSIRRISSVEHIANL